MRTRAATVGIGTGVRFVGNVAQGIVTVGDGQLHARTVRHLRRGQAVEKIVLERFACPVHRIRARAQIAQGLPTIAQVLERGAATRAADPSDPTQRVIVCNRAADHPASVGFLTDLAGDS